MNDRGEIIECGCKHICGRGEKNERQVFVSGNEISV